MFSNYATSYYSSLPLTWKSVNRCYIQLIIKKLKILHMLMKWKCHNSAGDLKCQGSYVTLLPLNDEHITWLQINTSSLAVSSRILHDHRAWRSGGFIMTNKKLGHLGARGMKWWRHGMLQDSNIRTNWQSYIMLLCLYCSMTLELKHDDVRKCRHFLCYWLLCREPHITGGFPSLKTINADVWCLIHCLPEQAIEQTIELLVIYDAMALMWCPNEKLKSLNSSSR